MKNNRIDILDGFRVLAILIVMLYHFYSSYPELYHYNFDSSIFYFGYLGVEFFFMISGFVIFITLNNSKSFIEFIKKRYIRLMPGMLICSIITFCVFRTTDLTFFLQGKEFKNLLFSNTFLSPSIPNKLLGTNFGYMDYAYWSLWVEIIFYVLISVLFFINKKTVILNFSIISILGTVMWYFFGTEENLLQLSIHGTIHKILSYIPFVSFLIWFLIGIIISKLYLEKADYKNIIYLIFLFALVYITSEKQELKWFVIISVIVWFVFLFRNSWLNFLGGKIMSKLGRTSYSVYLIHQMVGLVIIIKLSPYFGQYNWIIPILLIVLFFGFGLFSFQYLEKPIGKKIHNILFKKNK